MDVGGHADFALRNLYLADGVAQRGSRRKIEGKSDRRKLALVVDGEGMIRWSEMCEGAEGHELACLRCHINAFQTVGVLLVLGQNLKHDVILIQAHVHVRDLALTE